MKKAVFSLILLVFCSCSGTEPAEERKITKFSVTEFGQLTVKSRDIVRISGTGFDTNTTLRASNQALLIDTLTENAIVFRAPWPRGTYAISLQEANTTLPVGELVVTRDALPPVGLEDGFYTLVQITASGTSSSSGWEVFGSSGQREGYTYDSEGEDTVKFKDLGMPWIEVKGDSLIGRSNPIDAKYYGRIDRANARIFDFIGGAAQDISGGHMFSTLTAKELDVTRSGLTYVFRANGSLSFSSLVRQWSTGNPRPSQGRTDYRCTPNSIVMVELKKWD